MSKIKRVETRFIEKQLELARKELQDCQNSMATSTSATEWRRYWEGRIDAMQWSLGTLTHLLENCTK